MTPGKGNLSTYHDNVVDSEACRLLCCAAVAPKCEWFEYFTPDYPGVDFPIGRCHFYSKSQLVINDAAAISATLSDCNCFDPALHINSTYQGADMSMVQYTFS